MKPPDRRRPRWCSSLLPLTLTLLSAALGCVCVCVCVWARVAERAEGQQLQSLLRQTRAAELALSALRPLLPNTTTTTTHPLAHSHTHTLPPPAGAGAAPVLARKPRPRQSPRPQPAAPLAPFSAEEQQQARSTLSKVACLQQGQGAVLLYHTRKCAGTTLKSYLEAVSQRWHVRFMESEGETLARKFLTVPGVLTATSLRHPIARVMSLYWYEHVAWYNEVTHEMNKCKPLSEWVDAWADGSDWKRKFLAKNPTSVYVEVQNYFVKSFSGWTAADGPASREHLQAAKDTLSHMDVVLLTEHMREPNTSALLEHSFGHPRHPQRGAGGLGGTALLQKRSNKVDMTEVKRLEALLASDKDTVYKRLEKLNELDMELWSFAQDLVTRRYMLAEGYYSALGGSHGHEQANRAHQGSVARCKAENSARLPIELEKQLGIFRPPGHKGPFR